MSVTSGWGRLTYGQANWNQATTLKTGWGAQAWTGGGAWGQTSNQVITLTGQSISSSLGSPDNNKSFISFNNFCLSFAAA